jgi:hypothetical protein
VTKFSVKKTTIKNIWYSRWTKPLNKFATAQPGEDHTALTKQMDSYQAPTIELDQSPSVTEEAMVHNY